MTDTQNDTSDLDAQLDEILETFYEAVFEHAYELGQELPDEKNPKMVFDPCNAEDQEKAKAAITALIAKREQAAELRGFKNGYINGQHDEMKDVEVFWTKQPFPSDGDTTMFIHNRVTHLNKQVAELQATKPEKEG